MTAPDPRVGEIENRLATATPGPWETMRSGLLGTRVVRVDGEWDGLIPDEFVTLVTPALRIYCDADLIANAPTDLAYLLAELRKAHEALARVEALAERAESHGNLYVFVDDLTAALAAANGDGNG